MGVPGRRRALATLEAEAHDCRRCDLWRDATQVVFGDGPIGARLMLIGEQPGDREDLAGQPFVGPAGRILDGAIATAGLRREELYLTNAVKHFKHERRGARRIHQKPRADEIEACEPWWRRELELVRPGAIVLLGATAIRAVVGAGHTVSSLRGVTLDVAGTACVATIHPSAALRARDSRAQLIAGLTDDLRRAAQWTAGLGQS
jgi:uracil-DNA glycosylase family protein